MSSPPPPSGPYRDLPSLEQVQKWISEVYRMEWGRLVSVARACCERLGGVADAEEVAQAAITSVAMGLLSGKVEYQGPQRFMKLLHKNILYQAKVMSRKERRRRNLSQSGFDLDLLAAPDATVDPVSLLDEMFTEHKAELSPSHRKVMKLALDVDLDETWLTAYQRRLFREAITKLLKLWNDNR